CAMKEFEFGFPIGILEIDKQRPQHTRVVQFIGQRLDRSFVDLDPRRSRRTLHARASPWTTARPAAARATETRWRTESWRWTEPRSAEARTSQAARPTSRSTGATPR